MNYSKHWKALLVVLIFCFTLLGFYGKEVYRSAPPIPTKILNQNNETLASDTSILNGQLAWQSIGGQQLGSIFGHGAYQAPDWTADWLHREITIWLEIYSFETFQKPFKELDKVQSQQAQAALQEEYKNNHVDSKNQLRLSLRREHAVQQTAKYYIELFGNNPKFKKTRQSFAMKENTLPDLERRKNMTHFFFWTAWASATIRPNTTSTYTNNWPHEPLLDNAPSSGNIFWSIVSIILLITGIGALVWYSSFKRKEEEEVTPPNEDPLGSFQLTSSQKALWKYVATIVLLFSLQVLLGGVLAHYTVEGQDFYGIPLSNLLPYSLVRTWHLQMALFWIATSFLAAGLFLAPIIHGGKDPKHQRLGVNILWVALLVVVGGSLTGEALAIHQKISLENSFFFGIQGYEYTDLGRFWQYGLLIGLLLWLGLMLRGIAPALKQTKDKSLLLLFTGAATAIGLFYGGALFYGARTHISIMEFWRWWVVHLWVEGFFEVFTTVAIAFIFANLGLISLKTATRGSLASSAIFLLGGIPGTFHHLYFSGTPISIMAVGACFSALEVVPLVLIGIEAKENWKLQHAVGWMKQYRWPIHFFTAVAFWNFLGAGVFGFLINPPISLYYVQGLNLTPVHAHAATFGVYGMLSLGLILFILRRLKPTIVWNDKTIKFSFWSLNIGLSAMILFSLLPIGLIQAFASMNVGLWYARSEEFMLSNGIPTLKWLRVIGDTIFILGTLAFAKHLIDVIKTKEK